MKQFKNKIKFSFFVLFSFFSFVFGQVQDPVHMAIDFKKIEDQKYLLTIKAKIDSSWYVYSQKQSTDFGPIPLSIELDNKMDFILGVNKEVPLPKQKFEAVFETDVYFFKDSLEITQIIENVNNQSELKGFVTYQTCNGNMCLPPEDVPFRFELSTTTSSFYGWEIFLSGFLGGLLALLTPCVFPMIPVTVSFFSRKKDWKMPIIYGFSIIFIYVFLGLSITFLAGADTLNELASNAFFNLIFFFVFLFFALSFLGLFEIQLPNHWLNAINDKAGAENYLGLFFMAFTLSLVSFSCTGPLIGTLLVQVALAGSYWGPALGMLGFSTALALPFTFFSFFPQWIQKLPKSGSWLEKTKIILGFLEIALAMKFLSLVDLAYHWDFLTRELFLSIWIALFMLLGFYLLGFFNFNTIEKEKTGIGSFFLALLSFAFVFYLIPGLWGAPLKLVSGIVPPRTHSEDQFRFIQSPQIVTDFDLSSNPQSFSGPHGLRIYKDFEVGQRIAKQEKKPILLDFTGFSCVNCRKMEDYVWSDPQVLALLKKFVIISLYVDDKKKLTTSYLSKTTGKMIKTFGNRWSDFQIEHYQTNAQPYYMPIFEEPQNMLLPALGYEPEIAKYKYFLEQSLQNYEKRSFTY